MRVKIAIVPNQLARYVAATVQEADRYNELCCDVYFNVDKGAEEYYRYGSIMRTRWRVHGTVSLSALSPRRKSTRAAISARAQQSLPVSRMASLSLWEYQES